MGVKSNEGLIKIGRTGTKNPGFMLRNQSARFWVPVPPLDYAEDAFTRLLFAFAMLAGVKWHQMVI